MVISASRHMMFSFSVLLGKNLRIFLLPSLLRFLPCAFFRGFASSWKCWGGVAVVVVEFRIVQHPISVSHVLKSSFVQHQVLASQGCGTWKEGPDAASISHSKNSQMTPLSFSPSISSSLIPSSPVRTSFVWKPRSAPAIQVLPGVSLSTGRIAGTSNL